MASTPDVEVAILPERQREGCSGRDMNKLGPLCCISPLMVKINLMIDCNLAKRMCLPQLPYYTIQSRYLCDMEKTTSCDIESEKTVYDPHHRSCP
ncbi:hypothetical protein CEXT_288511 [Caerostris extrusa]|uniref:Uncharacterized protein n=1 Tax=Caerostris extrusa TaxID=172846 RepID=A0AAV4Y5Y1_CAEEX|nr:hypothetical protein CEXT_288511 [Caerostris extrusa]